ncbi:MAG: ADP-ribosylglycohydrolase family protein [Gallionella sp.]|nr:ADP-ribosylglycohydrolase family protein [Gallionella sp.]MDP1940145.1 ADP-ribosylglycohydrolase family protein [Gallionella sp.]
METPEITPRDRFRGCLLAGAIGDALGAPLEFMTLPEIKKRFGKHGLTDYAPAFGGIGRITDDTQMTLWTAEGLLRAVVRYKTRGIASVEGCVNHACLRWLQAQGITSRCPDVGTDGWLYQVKELHARRAPGMTCISALQAKTSLGDLYASNDSKGCGGVMRVAPAGLMFTGDSIDEGITNAFQLGGNLARLTHGHPCSTLSSGVMGVLVHLLVAGHTLPTALGVGMNLLDTADDDGLIVWGALLHAEQLAASRTSPQIAIKKLGEGWVAEEALAIAVFSCLRAKTLPEALLMAVNHGGDSDSTGSIAGNLMGAWFGTADIPEHWLEQLELREVIETVADDLHDCADWNLSLFEQTPEAENICLRYPGW